MPENSIQSKLRETFSPASKDVWKQFASQELEGKNPDDVLSWNSDDHIAFSAYYDASDENEINRIRDFRLTVAADPYFGPSRWLNVPCITVTSSSLANQTALQHLTHGADGIFFKSDKKFDFNDVLKGVEWQYCSLFFEAPDAKIFFEGLKSFANAERIQRDRVSGGFFWDAIPNFNLENFSEYSSLKNILKVQPSTPVSEIASALSLGVRMFEASEKTSEKFFRTISFSMPVGTQFLETIAKLKALRFLWFQIAQAYNFNSFDSGDLLIHANSMKWIEDSFHPHGNMLKSTTACMASVIGGADVITIHAEDESNTMMTRIARNVSNLLREESHFDKVSDPAAGAYAIEVMTSKFAEEAWKIFQGGQKR